MKKKTILIVDDTIAILNILNDILEDYDVIDATNGEDALQIIEEENIDLILLDIVMPNMDGYEVCSRLKANKQTADIPVIFITAKTDEDSIAKAYEVGGADFVTKLIKPRELLSRVKKELKMQDMVEELKLLASTDPMTKLYNRRYFSKISEYTVNLAKRDEKDISIVILDIDDFKHINDTYGHHIGDEVIISLANILLKNKRKSDIVCRYGGEEFVLLLPNTSFEGAKIVAQKLQQDTEQFVLELADNFKINFTISLGVAYVDITQPRAIEVAIKYADEALYRAKNSGKNKVCY